MAAPSGKIKLSGALSAPAKAPYTAGSRKSSVKASETGSTAAGSPPSRLSKFLSRFRRLPPNKQTDAHKQANSQEPSAASQGRVRATGRASLLPGGVWLWCLLGLAIGLGVWLGGRAYLRSRLVEQLDSAESEAVALQSIDALLRLDADATIDVSRGLAHPEFMVANAAYRALTGQLDAWRTLSAAEQLRRMQQVADALQRIPTDLDQDHRILLAGLASRIYAEALSNREAGTADLLADCKRIMALSDPRSLQEPTTASVSTDRSERLASSTSFRSPGVAASLSDTLSDNEAISPVPPPLPGNSSAASLPPQRQIIQKMISDDDAAGQPVADPQSQSFEENTVIPSLPSLESSSATRATGMPRLSATAQDELTGNSSRAGMHLTSATSIISDAERRKSQAALARAAREEQAAEATISGMEELPIEQLVRLLASIQPRVSQAAALMLRQKGMSEANLELAIELATGSTQQRRDLLQAIAARDDLDPRPWLLWMATDGEVTIRQQAVGLLAPLLDIDVRRRLRLLMNKESDEQVAATLRRVLALADNQRAGYRLKAN